MVAHIALRLVCGMSSAWCVMPRRDVTAGYFRIQMLVGLGLLVLGALATGAQPDVGTPLPVGAIRGLAAFGALVAFAGSVLWTLARRRAATALTFAVASLAVTTDLGSLMMRDLTWLDMSFVAVGELASAWALGGLTTTMLLGHWYLTAPMMSIDPLRTMTRLMIAALAFRGLVSATALLTVDASMSATHAVWLTMRWIGGIAGPIVLCVLVLRILRYRNTQSATGVLFAAVVLAFLGETAAILLTGEFHWPL